MSSPVISASCRKTCLGLGTAEQPADLGSREGTPPTLLVYGISVEVSL